MKRKVLERFPVLGAFCCYVVWKEGGVLGYLSSVLGLGPANFCKGTSNVISLSPKLTLSFIVHFPDKG